ncbi:peptidoglycan editing factor PgeF [Aestuariispira insulae]|uniref:Purine nucleoside phosphorylase n=1 Tax=Aestuariispira insulae TaxID=1461337 RepID=A0A3D9HXR6_9PROT|nr:peptidoglycan editing factor PgeF [Aestuariispira insulae]RED54298.1 hypothetical protein DFP90_1011101 [Aestuariispira insulae]
MTATHAHFLTETNLQECEGVRHGFFTRKGGVSEGIYQGLNCGPGSDDDPDHVRENRARVARAMQADPGDLATLYQIHSADVVTVDTVWDRVDAPRADAMVTDRPGILLGILTADCGPLLFADRKAGVVGAAHAGWKGALGGVGGATIDAMETLGAARENIVAVLGPCIAQESYEVGPDFPLPFLEQDPDNARFFKSSSRAGHHMFDMAGYIVSRLQADGIGQVEALNRDTREAPELFFSYRRTTLAGEPDYGRQISAIMLEG